MEGNVHIRKRKLSKGTLALKRSFDLVFSFIGLVILSPIFLIVCMLIKAGSKGPVFFKQVRVGQHEQLFKILKFRTMIVDAEKVGKQITVGKDPRITKIGYILRKYKIDELPQLINVLLGDMSLVGPRPEVPKYTQYYTEEQKQIFLIKPGITDYSSIKYSDESEILSQSDNPEKTYIEVIMIDKLSLNLNYLENISLMEDIRIIFKTLFKIAK